MTTSHEVLESRFRSTRLRPGYSVAEVDDYLDRCRATLAHYEGGGRAGTWSSPTTLSKDSRDAALLTAAEVRSVRLPTTRWREGYVMEEVDDLLDGVVNELVRWETVAR
ncbi:DivIVA domain-containing protein [Sanguibacter keddieii]|nr:DivIVA domain-containing protein [Sanguibacter keddieii]